MGKLTISMAIFNSYVSLPEGNGMLMGFSSSMIIINGKTHYFYGSIPINTIFRGMNIHQSQKFWGVTRNQGFDPSPPSFSKDADVPTKPPAGIEKNSMTAPLTPLAPFGRVFGQ